MQQYANIFGKYTSDRSLSLLVGGKAMIKHIKLKYS